MLGKPRTEENGGRTIMESLGFSCPGQLANALGLRKESSCKGCGTCMATSPKKAIFVWHFKPEQLQAEVKAALGITV